MWAVVAALAVSMTAAGPANAQHRGGVWYGGQHSGGYGGSGYHGGYSGPYYGHNYGYYPHHSGLSLGFYAGSPYGYSPYSYGSYPRYNSGYSGYYYPSNYYSGPAYDGSEYVPPDVTVTRSGYYSPPTTTVAPSDNRARIHVRLPADATLWIDDEATQQAGGERDFLTPALQPGTTYQYTLKVRWMQGADPVERTMKVDVRANETSQADFMR